MVVNPVQCVIEALDAHGCKPRPYRRGYLAHCPAHEDSHPSLHVQEGDDGRALLICRAGCFVEEVLAALGLAMRDLFL